MHIVNSNNALQEFVIYTAVHEKPILLDLCAGTQSVGDSIDRDLWDYVALDIDCFLGKVPDIQCDIKLWESTGEQKLRCPQGSVGCIWFRYELHVSPCKCHKACRT